jgi:hypothetical protein
MLHALRSAYEYSGNSAIITLLANYFAFLSRQPAAAFSSGWGATRWGDTIDVLHWLYDRTGDASLLDLVTKIHANSANWVGGLPSLHNVNIAQGFREPAQYWVSSGDAAHRAATYTRYADVMGSYGQFPGGGFAGDENARPGYADPRQGFETCGIVEYMASHEILHRITGDPVWADRIEDLAFNSLPAALDPLGRSTHYITSANSIDLDDAAKTLGQFSNGFAMQAYLAGVDQYRCCPHNYGQGWPYLVEEMWLATPDGGLCAAVYGPSTVTAQVTGGVAVTVTPRRSCSSPTAAPPTTTGSCGPRPGLARCCASRTSTAARYSAWPGCPRRIPRRSSSSPTPAPPTAIGWCSRSGTLRIPKTQPVRWSDVVGQAVPGYLRLRRA